MKLAPPIPYPCTDCGGDAYFGYSNWKDASGRVIIEKKERLCQRCFEKRKQDSTTETPCASSSPSAADSENGGAQG